jgi:hypothetical protein
MKWVEYVGRYDCNEGRALAVFWINEGLDRSFGVLLLRIPIYGLPLAWLDNKFIIRVLGILLSL